MTFSLELDIAVVSNVGDVDETLRVQKTTVAEVEVATKPMNHAFAPLVFSLLASAAVFVARERVVVFLDGRQEQRQVCSQILC